MALLVYVKLTLKNLELTKADRGVAALARTYARAIDAGQPIDVLGPKLLAALEALGASPRARAAVLKGRGTDDDRGTTNPLDELRAKREERQRRSQIVDATAETADP